jgi:hypothetical protein
MALDYSKLTTAELEAIANDDFTKLSNRTLRALTNEPEPKSITDNIKDFGKATASLADTGLNAVTGMLDYAAYPLARAFGRSPEQATQETSSPKDVIGRGLGITQDPAYQSELSRRMMAGMSEGVEKYAVKPLSSATGLPQQDVSNMVGSAMLGAGVKAQPYINRAGQKVAQGMYAAEPYIAEALKAPVKAPYQFAKGAIEGLVNKEYNPATSAMVPLRDTYTPPPAAERFMGQAKTPPYKIGDGPSSGPLPNMPQQSLSQLQSQARPTSELVGGTAGRVAQAISPKTLAGETLVPLRGQGMQAFGERVGRGVRTNPLQAMGEVGLTALTGIPFKTIGQGIGEAGASYLGAKTGFMPGFSQKLGQAQQAVPTPPPRAPAPGPVNPTTMNYPLTVQGPGQQLPPSVMTAPDLSRRVNIEGQSSVLPSQINTTNSQTARPQPQGPTPQQMAIQKTQEIVAQQTSTPAPVIRQPVATTPASNVQTQPVTRSSSVINKELTTLDNQMTNLRDEALSNRLTPNTPEGQAYSNQLNEMANRAKSLQTELELAKKAEKSPVRKANKAPPNVSQMMIGEPKATGPLEQSLVSKRSFNGDLQKYRYGTEKSPLTLEEYNHLKNSEFIDKQNTRDILMGMRPDLTEYSIWYKDKSGKVQNMQTYGNEFKKK